MYKPPILCQDVNHSNDIHLRSTGKDDNKVQEPEEVPADDSSSNSSEACSTQCHVTNNHKGPVDKICMMKTRLACNRAIESSYWRMDNDLDVGLLTGYVLYRFLIELQSMDLDTFPH
jgi:hypothetical protein